ncbi:ribonuclease T2 family protein [Sphingomonas nostoxanthinifaciens]|uniref:ribonuclease T2 family protein n=1 Tax=Sphingomonas nostoxanthinifaciens TaxID=2872652 RepID=UPI001CC1CD94|nr:ribonuclease T [Sphingomonas nostoxanthinifaciens]UAK23324.1 ribonuclease T [Sphingomonas nostoxanthinifaciens]
MIRSLLAFLALTMPAAALAAPACPMPSTLDVPTIEGASQRQPARTVPITNYTLALIWTPEHCRTAVPGAESFACHGVGEDRFTLHGLWPDGDHGTWPQWCAPAAALPAATLRAHYCATPSAQLMQHEWAKHGTCMSGYTPDRFFALSNRLFEHVASPDMTSLARRDDLTVGQFVAAFALANPAIGADAVQPRTNASGWLQEVWICLDTRFKPRRCAVSVREDAPLHILAPRL